MCLKSDLIDGQVNDLYVKNFTVLTLSIRVADREYLQAPLLTIDLKSPESETADIQTAIPITLLNFYEPLDFSVEECRLAYRKPENKELLTRISNFEVSTMLGKRL